MKPEHFCLWLQGFVELARRQPTPEEWQSICEHLAKVFEKQTPPVEPSIDPELLRKWLTDPDRAQPSTPYTPPPVSPWQPDSIGVPWETVKIIC